MANVKNLKIQLKNGTIWFDPRSCFYNNLKVKEAYFNNVDYVREHSVLIWKNSDLFRFIKTTPSGSYEPNTLIFRNFSDNVFGGEYKSVDSTAEMTEERNMYVIEVEDNE